VQNHPLCTTDATRPEASLISGVSTLPCFCGPSNTVPPSCPKAGTAMKKQPIHKAIFLTVNTPPKYKLIPHKNIFLSLRTQLSQIPVTHMDIHPFYDEGLAHASYAIRNGDQVALIDPARNPKQYLDFAAHHGAKIIAVIETHPHADFVSSHLELHHLTGATI